MYRLASSVRLRHVETDNSYWAFDIAGGNHYELNETAYEVLRAVESGASLRQTALALTSEFDIDQQEAERDAAELLSGFEEDGLVEREE